MPPTTIPTLISSGAVSVLGVQIPATGNSHCFLQVIPDNPEARHFLGWEGQFPNTGDSRSNNVTRLGWNVGAGGGTHDNMDAAIADEWESHYTFNGSSFVERHITYTSPSGAAFRLISWSADKGGNVISGSLTGDAWTFLSRQSGAPLLRIDSGTTQIFTGNLLLGSQAGAGYRLDVEGKARVYNQSGVSTIQVRSGSSQAGNPLSVWNDAGGALLAYVGSDGSIFSTAGSQAIKESKASDFIQNDYSFGLRNGSLNMKSTFKLAWTATAHEYDPLDTAITRTGPGTIAVGSGAAGDSTGTVKAAIFTGNAASTSGVDPARCTAPSSSSAAGVKGELRFDEEYLYICVELNNWKRVALSSW